LSIQVGVNLQASVTVSPGGVFVGDDGDYVINGMNHSATLTGSSTPPVTKVSAFQQALTAGAATIDLTSLPDEDGVAAAVTFSGLKVQWAHFENPSTNANSITISEGASNGYELAGNAWTVTLDPGEQVVYLGNDTSPDVSGTTKNIDLAGTGTQALNVTLIAG
jgi:hypothetical protein